ncbi:hypothetical protein TrRE_jg11566, partial [Triparma retinervis]
MSSARSARAAMLASKRAKLDAMKAKRASGRTTRSKSKDEPKAPEENNKEEDLDGYIAGLIGDDGKKEQYDKSCQTSPTEDDGDPQREEGHNYDEDSEEGGGRGGQIGTRPQGPHDDDVIRSVTDASDPGDVPVPSGRVPRMDESSAASVMGTKGFIRFVKEAS